MLIDPAQERSLQEINRINRMIVLQNVLALMTAGGALAIAAIVDAWFVAVVSLFVLGSIKPLVVPPGSMRLVDGKSLRRVN